MLVCETVGDRKRHIGVQFVFLPCERNIRCASGFSAVFCAEVMNKVLVLTKYVHIWGEPLSCTILIKYCGLRPHTKRILRHQADTWARICNSQKYDQCWWVKGARWVCVRCDTNNKTSTCVHLRHKQWTHMKMFECDFHNLYRGVIWNDSPHSTEPRRLEKALKCACTHYAGWMDDYMVPAATSG